jgi:hypothetical protein
LNRGLQKLIVRYTKSQPATKVKTVMGKQYNKDQKKKRRTAYHKRKNAAVNAKKAAKA